MQNLSRACQDLPPPIRATDLDHKPLAFLAVGFRHTRAPTRWEGPVQVHHCRSGLLHQVGRGQAISNNHRENVRNFVWCSIICRFGIPKALVSDNGKQFDNLKLKNFCAKLRIKNYYSSPAHPQSNGQA